MGSGCGDPIVEVFLRPPGKLPVPVALDAGSPTLFTAQYTLYCRKCKQGFSIIFFGRAALCKKSRKVSIKSGSLSLYFPLALT